MGQLAGGMMKRGSFLRRLVEHRLKSAVPSLLGLVADGETSRPFDIGTDAYEQEFAAHMEFEHHLSALHASPMEMEQAIGLGGGIHSVGSGRHLLGWEPQVRFKELVKRHHPDANGGDRGAEERLGQVIKAYGQLRSSGYS